MKSRLGEGLPRQPASEVLCRSRFPEADPRSEQSEDSKLSYWAALPRMWADTSLCHQQGESVSLTIFDVPPQNVGAGDYALIAGN